MHIIIAILAVIAVVIVVGAIVKFIVQALAYIAAIVTIPSIAVMELLQRLGLTSPELYVVLHAALGGVIGFFWANRISQLFRRGRQRLSGEATSAADRPGGASFLQRGRQQPLRETAAEIWANRTQRYVAIAILVLLVLMAC